MGFYAARGNGNSMLPTIHRDSLLVLEKRIPEVGDVVHVRNRDYNYVHRLVEISGDTIVTKGDNSEKSEFASFNEISGVVIFHMPFQAFLATSMILISIEIVVAGFWSIRIFRGVLGRDLGVAYE
jgi:signal peptidase I